MDDKHCHYEGKSPLFAFAVVNLDDDGASWSAATSDVQPTVLVVVEKSRRTRFNGCP
jgi:hypothetical protein